MKCLEQGVIFAGMDGAGVEEELVAVDAGDDGRGSLTQAGGEGIKVEQGGGRWGIAVGGGGGAEGAEVCGQGFAGEGAAADGGVAFGDGGMVSPGADRRGPASGTSMEGIKRGSDHAPDGDLALGEAIAMLAEGGFEGGESELVDAGGAHQWVALDLLDVVGATGDDACLGSTEQLVAGETGDVYARGDALLHGGFVGEPPARGIVEAATAQVMHDGEIVGVGTGDERGEVGRFGEADDAEVAGVDGEEQGCVGGDGGLEVAGAGAVGGADFDEAGAALAHDVGDAEAAADLD